MVMKERERAAAVAAGENPYQGLHAFGEEDAHYFFGREADSEGLWETVQTQPLVVLLGASGSGKSSVARAGVLPRARAAGWAIATFRPEADPFRSLAAGLVATMEAGMSKADQLIETRKLAAAFREGTVPLTDVLSTVKEESSAGRVLLVGDQFEELYTLCPDPAERHRFVDLLLEAVSGVASGCLLLTMRADFLGRALGYRPFADALQTRQAALGPMTREELARAIEEPAALLDVTFEPGLVTRILDDVEAAPGGLPLLQFALTEMWERQIPKAGSEPLPLPEGVYGELRAALLACGPFDDDRELRAIFADPRLHPWRERAPQAGDAGARAEATIAALHGHYDGAQKPALALLLEALRDRIDPGDSCHGRLGGLVERLNGTPRRPEGGLLTHAAYEAIGEVEGALAGHADRVFAGLEPEAQAQARRLFVQLVQPGAGMEDTRRLAARSDLGNVPWELVARLAGARLVVTGQDATQEERVEVTHEALIQRWGRLQAWMDEDRTFRAWQERLRAALHQFETTEEDKDALLRGTALAEATEWLAQRADSLSERERAFIEESGAVARTRRRQRMAGVIAVVVLIVGAAVAFGLVQANAAREVETAYGEADAIRATGEAAARQFSATAAAQQEAMAEAEEAIAGEGTRAAEMGRAANAAATRAANVETFANARQLVLQGGAAYEQNPLLGLALVVEGLAIAGDGEQMEAVLGDSRERVFRWGRVAMFQEVSGWELSPDGSWLVVGYRDTDGELRDGASGALVETLPGNLGSWGFSPDGSWLVVGYKGADGELRDGASGALVETLNGVVGDWGFSPDGSRLMIDYDVDYDGADGELRDGASGALVETLDGTVRSWAFSPDGSRLVVAYVDADGELRDGASGALVQTLDGTVHSWGFSPDGSLLVVGYENADGELRDGASGALVETLAEDVRDWEFSPDGSLLLLDYPDADDELRDGASGALVETLAGEVYSWTFSPDGSRLLVVYYDSPGELRDGASGALVETLAGLVSAREFSPDGTLLRVAYADGSGELRHVAGSYLAAPLQENVVATTFITATQTVAAHDRQGRAFLLDLTWLEAMGGKAGTLDVEELLELACEYPLDNGAVLERPDIKAALQPYLEAVGLEEPQACKGF